MVTKKELERMERERSYRTMANWALVLSLASWLVLGIILAPASLILGIKALKAEATDTRITATIATIIGTISTAAMIFAFMVGMAAVAAWR